jgi:putative peptidoglycan lipid II flippase
MTEPTEAVDTGRSSALVASGIFLSRVSGLVRESAMGAYLGTGAAADAFRAALRIPNLMQNLLGEGVLSAAFIPVYAGLLADRDEEEAGRVAGAVAGLLAALTGVLVLVAVLFARPITAALAPGFTGETFELTVDLVRIMTAGIGFLVLSAWCLGVLNTHRRFFLSYVAPVVWNAAQIAVLVAVGVRGWAEADIAVALAWGVFAGGVLQFLIQVPTVRRVAPEVRLSVRRDLPGVGQVGRRFGPAVLGRGVVQVGAYIDLLLASLLAAGAVAALGYAQILYLLPISLFAMSVAAAELPELSRIKIDGDALGTRLRTGLGRITFFMTFTAVAYLAAGDLVVGALYERGRFEGDDTTLVWAILAAYSLGLLAVGASRLIQNVLYSQGDVKGPAAIAAVRVAFAAVLGVILMFQLDHVVVLDGELVGLDQLPTATEPLPEAVRTSGDTLRMGAVGLALASAISAWLELGLLRWRLGRGHGIGRSLIRFVVPALAALPVLLGLRWALGSLPDLVALPLVVGPAGLVYVGAASALGAPEASALLRPVRRLGSRP